MSELSAKQRAFLDELKILDYPAWLDLHPRPPDPPTMDLCIHEAAHASAMHAFGRAIDHAVVHDGHGLVMPLSGVEVDYFHHILVLLAGDMSTTDQPPLTRAEWQATIDGTREGTSDEATAVIVACALVGNNSAGKLAVIERGWNAAVDMFAEHGFWPAVQSVAETLRIRHRLEGTKIHQLADQHIVFGALKSKERYQWKN